jgi:hypothetical protein
MSLNEKIIEGLQTEGLIEIIKKDRAAEALTVGALRAGNSGVVVVDKQGNDKVHGGCHRMALLRMLGLSIPAEAYTHMIFEEGNLNEIQKVKRMINAPSLANYVIKHGDEGVTTKWHTSNGTAVTGRPDVVIQDTQGNYVWLFELKKKLTSGGVLNVIEDKKPDSSHLCQAAHYSWQLGFIPTTLMYSWPILKAPIAKKEFIHSREALQFVQLPPPYQKGTELTILPGDWYYHLSWDGGVLHYQCKGISAPIPTNITVETIKDFYEVTSAMSVHKNLGPRPTSSHVGVGVKAGYPPCSYCNLKEVCDKTEHDYEQWVDEVKLLAATREWADNINKRKE